MTNCLMPNSDMSFDLYSFCYLDNDSNSVFSFKNVSKQCQYFDLEMPLRLETGIAVLHIGISVPIDCI